jgi:glutathione S-transferase
MKGRRPDEGMRSGVRTFIYAAEATFLVHALAITYARWFSPPSVKDPGDLEKLGEGLAIKCQQIPRLVGL